MKIRNKLVCLTIFALTVNSVQAQSILSKSDVKNIEHNIQTLSADDMRGRSALTTDIGKAADFIAAEMKKIGLKPYAEDNYRQSFSLTRVSPKDKSIQINGEAIDPNKILVYGAQNSFHWTKDSISAIKYIQAGEEFSSAFRAIAMENKGNTLVIVDPSFENLFNRFSQMLAGPKFVEQNNTQAPKTGFILANTKPQTVDLQVNYAVDEFPLFNVAGILPGKSKKNEYVVFSGHYDHLGILPAVGQDSIANGADDDASGVTAMLALAKYYKEKNNNERTLIFVAFTAEEIGMYGSKYFSTHIDADQVTAMINMEMIGKDSKFGPNTLYITGYDHSDLGKIMQENLKNTAFKFYADPYTKQNLFYRSDNAVLAAKGVPAHSFSTSQMDQDNYYHTVKDEMSTLNIKNIVSSIEAIAIGASGIVEGKQTPSRVEKLRD